MHEVFPCVRSADGPRKPCSEDLLEHIRGRIREHGDEADIADLADAEAELAERRSRKGGRPPKG